MMISPGNEQGSFSNTADLFKLIRFSPDIICSIAEDLTFGNVSEASKKILGYAPHELTGKPYIQFVFKDDRQATINAVTNTQLGAPPIQFNNRFKHKKGHLVSLTWNASWHTCENTLYCTLREAGENEDTLNQLKESQYKLTTATRIAKLGYWQLRLDDSNRYWSDEVYEVFGVDRVNFINNPNNFYKIIHPEDRKRYREEQEQFRADLKNFELEYRIVAPDGSVRWIYELGNSSKDDDGNTILQGTVQDISTQKLLSISLKQSNERFVYAARASSDAIWDWDVVNNTVLNGEGFEKLFGYPVTDEKRDSAYWYNNIHADDRERVLISLQKVLKNKNLSNWTQEYKFRKASGDVACVIDHGIILRNEQGEAYRMVGAMQDITQQKNEAAKLKRSTDDLYKRNQELLQFGYVVSHNLRSPVANIMGITSILEIDKGDSKTVDRCINDLKTSILRLDGVIRDLSDLLSITDGSAELHKENSSLNEILANVKSDLDESISKSGIKITLPRLNYNLYTHKAYLHSIFFNLISNAIKYKSASKPVIAINVEIKNSVMMITVTDNGVGIDLNRYGDDIFKPYKRFSENIEGKGLGLFLVKSHVDVLNGKISVRSKPGYGTIFSISFPLSKITYIE